MFIVNFEGAIRKDNRWIIIERSKKEELAGGLLSLVGGKVEVGNLPHVLESNLQREIAEEIGILVKSNMQYVHSVSFTTDQGLHVVNVIYLCEYEAGTLEIIERDEVEKIYELTTEELLENPNAPEYLKQYIQYASSMLAA